LGLTAARFGSLLFAALALAPALAHLLELPNKIGLSRDDYLIVQQIYRGWALLGFVIAGALLSTLVLMIMVRNRPKAFALTIVAFVCILGTQIVFWTFTFPANQQTNNWTVLPENWEALRARWEYSHAASAVLNLIAFISLICSVLTKSTRDVEATPNPSFHRTSRERRSAPPAAGR
jgi:ABC-type cobalamin transport system permease subunit